MVVQTITLILYATEEQINKRKESWNKSGTCSETVCTRRAKKEKK
jgi:hypothetical protein